MPSSSRNTSAQKVKRPLEPKGKLYRRLILQILRSLIAQCELSMARHLNTPLHLQRDKAHYLRMAVDDQVLLSRVLYHRSEAVASSVASEVRRSSRMWSAVME
jgi:hypothetical protein